MIVVFHKDSHERHRLECIRPDGSTTAADLETRSLLRHDIVHFLVESKARLRNSVFAAVAGGRDLDQLTMPDGEGGTKYQGQEIGTTEMVVAILQGALRDEMPPGVALEHITRALASQGRPVPEYLTPGFISSLLPEYRFFMKRWAALKTGDSIRLEFARSGEASKG